MMKPRIFDMAVSLGVGLLFTASITTARTGEIASIPDRTCVPSDVFCPASTDVCNDDDGGLECQFCSSPTLSADCITAESTCAIFIHVVDCGARWKGICGPAGCDASPTEERCTRLKCGFDDR